MHWTVRSESSGNPLTDLHANSFSVVSSLFDGQDPRQRATYESRAQTIAPMFDEEHRSTLASCLTDYARRLGSNENTFVQIEKLRNPESVAVVTGQQAGLFTGPLYTLYKALSAIGLAKRFEEDLGRPVLPLFWVASEDHDFAEVNHAYVMDYRDDVHKIQLNYSPSPHQMVFHAPLSEEAVTLTLRQVDEWLPDGQGKLDMLQTLRAAWESHDSLSTWFARILTRLTADYGLVVFDPCLPPLRQLAQPVWKEVIMHHEEMVQSIDAAYRDVESLGFQPGVLRDSKNTTLFYVQDGKRYVLEIAEEGFLRARGIGIVKSIHDWLRLAEMTPTAFSANVLLRPVVQDFVIPTLVYVGGPSEIAYHPLARGTFHALSRKLPPLIHRQRMRLMLPGVSRSLQKWHLGGELAADPEDLVGRWLSRTRLPEITQSFEEMRTSVGRKWEEWANRFSNLGPQVSDMARAQIHREVSGLNRLEQKTSALYTQAYNAELSQLRRIEHWVWPDGRPQERRYSPLTPWSLYGRAWMSELPLMSSYESPCPVYHVEL